MPLGHPDTRRSEGVYVIQRSADIAVVEEALRYSLITLVANASRDLTSADAVRAIRNICDVIEGSFLVVPFFPE